MIIYFDTSCILPYWISHESYHDELKAIFALTDDGGSAHDFTAVVSGLCLAEIASVVERQARKFRRRSVADLATAYIQQTMKLPNLQLWEPFPDSASNLLIYPIFSQSILLSSTLKLKTLDNLHLGVIAELQVNEKFGKIEYFATGDKEILDSKADIMDKLGVKVVTPAEVLSLLES